MEQRHVSSFRAWRDDVDASFGVWRDDVDAWGVFLSNFIIIDIYINYIYVASNCNDLICV